MDGLQWKTLLKWMIWGENPLFSETSKFEKSQPRMPAGALFWAPFQRLFAGVPWLFLVIEVATSNPTKMNPSIFTGAPNKLEKVVLRFELPLSFEL